MAVIISYKGNFLNISGEFVLLALSKLYKESGLNSPKLSLLNYGSDSTGDIIPPSTNDSNFTFTIYCISITLEGVRYISVLIQS